MINIQENVPLAPYTTLKIGGPAKFFVEVKSLEELKEALEEAKNTDNPYLVFSGGSNLLVNDKGFEGLVILYKEQGISSNGNTLTVKAGTTLQDFIDYANQQGLAGVEKMAGIPGSVGGAIYGNAGAYGQTISDKLVKVLVTDGEKEFYLNKEELDFDYRDSNFKRRKDLVIVEAEFLLEDAQSIDLKNTSTEIIQKRSEKYPPGTKCPGSFFKNLLLSDLAPEIVEIAPKDFYGKLPSAWLLDQVGAKGGSKGDIKIADYHANLFINNGNGIAQDFFDLAREWKQKVKEKYNVDLEPEVQLVGFDREL